MAQTGRKYDFEEWK